MQPIQTVLQTLFDGNLPRRWSQFWQWIQAQQTRQLISIGLITALILWIFAAILLKLNVAHLTWQKAISIGEILLLGGYGDVFGGLQNDSVPWWVQTISLLITLVSLLFVLGVLGLVADHLISSRLDFFRKRPPIPKQNHVVLVGLGRVGQQVATVLHSFKQPLVAITEQRDRPTIAADIPVLTGDPIQELQRTNLTTAKSVILVTDDQMLNLEAALIARDTALQSDRDLGLVIRTYTQRFSNNLTNLLPNARLFTAYGLSGEAFAGAAFGENILGLFRLDQQTVLVTEYDIEHNDTLEGKLLFQIAYGYGVVPIFHQRGMHPLEGDLADFLMPSDEHRVQMGDRLIVLATINGLRRIERGELAPPKQWTLTVQKPLNPSSIHYSGNDLARISGCSLDSARRFMENLPGTITLSLYDQQAHQLRQALEKYLAIELLS